MAAIDFVKIWLNEAYAMEEAQQHLLAEEEREAYSKPEVQRVIAEHRKATAGHVEQVRDCLQRLGASVTPMESGAVRLLELVQPAAAGAAEDALVKHALMAYAAEHFEIAAYQAIGTAASAAGDLQTARACDAILADEQKMADWWHQQLPRLVQDVQQQQSVDHVANPSDLREKARPTT